MGRVKTDHRNRLGEKTLERLMRISMEGCPLEHFDPKATTDLFFASRRHPNVEPYKDGKRSQPEDTASVDTVSKRQK